MHIIHPDPRPRARRSLTACAVIGALALSLGLIGMPASADPPTEDPVVAAGFGGGWLANQVTEQGFVPGPTDAPDISATLHTAIALGMAGVEQATFAQIVSWLQANVESVIVLYGSDSPGQLGYLLMIARLAGLAPGDFGGVDLPARLGGTLGAYAPGLYGADDPTYDGVFRQSLALLGLRSHNLAAPAAAVTWLSDQQCDTPAAAAGGWQPYRADTALDCDPPDPNLFTGPDTNSTALAVMAEIATGGGASLANAIGFLADAESSGAGWAFVPGGDDDPNSAALVIMALEAAGEDTSGATWQRGGVTATAALLSWQLGCDAPTVDAGGFVSPFSDGYPDLFATRQAIWAASGRTFPVGPAEFGPTPDPCAAPEPTTTTSLPSPGAPTATVATVAAVAPAFTG